MVSVSRSLAHQDDVGILAKRRPDSLGKAPDLGPDLPLNDQAHLARVDELDRILQRDDVQPTGAVQVIDHGGQRGGLPRAGRPCDEDQPLVMAGQALHHRRKAEVVQTGNLGGDHAEGGADASQLAEQVDPESPHAVARVGEVQVISGREGGPLGLRQDLVHQDLELVFRQVPVLDGHQRAVHPQHGGDAHGEMDIRAALLLAQLEERVEAGHHDPSPSIRGSSARSSSSML